MQKVTVKTATEYDILIGRGLLKQAGTEIKKRIAPCKAAIITDKTVFNLYAEDVRDSLQNAGFSVCIFAFPAGENNKCMHTLSDILEFFAEQEMTRQDIVVALGGGVVGDIAGFAAAVYQRGIRYVQIPTTFLAAIDSSVGGKTAVDLKAGKNLAGAFHQPQFVLCDVDTLHTLEYDIFADGTAEALKYGIIGNPALFDTVASGNFAKDLENIITQCVSMKRDIVEEDEFETGNRKLLNLGHTFGHAIEKKSHFQISHGHAVAVGLHLIAQAAEAKGIAQCGTAKRIRTALLQNCLPVKTEFSPAELAEATLHDKKRSGNTISFVFPEKIGHCRIEKISVAEVKALAEMAKKQEENRYEY